MSHQANGDFTASRIDVVMRQNVALDQSMHSSPCIADHKIGLMGDRRSAMGVEMRDLDDALGGEIERGESQSGRLTSEIPISSRVRGVGKISGLVT